MKLFALLDMDNKVFNISVADDSWSADGWIEYTESNPAFIGGDYVDGYFYPPQPFESWIRNGQGNWESPKPRPEGIFWVWNEDLKEWVNEQADTQTL